MTSNLAVRGGKPLRTQPFHPWPIFDEADRDRLVRVLEGGVWSGEGPRERELERAFAARHDAPDAVAVTNGTVSLLLCLRALGVRPGDEVIVPALTWVATATCVLEANAVPVMVDVDPKTFCIDPAAVNAAITSRTVAIIPVHLYSCMADMDSLRRIAERHSLAIIEDCAHAHGARWRGKSAGSIGELGSFSFQSSKPMTAGEGGAIIGRDKALLDKVYSQKNCGRHNAERGIAILGGNHRMTEWQAAILLGQLSRLDDLAARREASIAKLRDAITGLPGIRIVADQPEVTQRPLYRLSFHYDARAAHDIPLQQFLEAVRAEGVPIEAAYRPVYDNPLYADSIESVTWYPGKLRRDRCPTADRVSFQSAFTLPHEVLLGPDEDLHDVARAMRKVLSNAAEAAGLSDRAKEKVKGLLRKVL